MASRLQRFHGARGILPERKLKLLKGETFRQRLAIPMLGEAQ
jgi:hypothetical protein